ncbi:MAG: 3-hydroxyacyl-CoA dehydrogenase/enoyl-CoA hydratase family protein [Bacteroidota bacterium]|nr:3-hydroxyacyl-CoA dehydrogenase/enoyl-CoA hydratase family protein [Bacteroidota bacterium]MDP4233215.1 3-hydroxyacyl-CoA dehydrogenase/enoyl-CoA hydratase family protein [Bacteroidota bacterium]MDP4242166.1 3-hydroxyacyl-CoA dehydrogenase/enoyl-CoA hydratase family protein [Bacteroidota bacterium]MDP4287816.1 3-hydroxyacyl-CoA dehydrogenase/enoyl-CoA hydratase family protein [Bacteroidota bacterium]
MKAIETVGVVGAGTMGAAIAQKFAQEGFTVILHDRTLGFVERGMAALKASLAEGVARKVFTSDQVEDILGRIHGTAEATDLAVCDLVVEAIFEDLEAKKALFAKLSAILRDEAIIATNTSSFSVSVLAKSVSNRARFCGVHYFFHAAKNRLVEIIPGECTSPETVQALQRFAFETGKDPIVCRDRPGFVVNRFFVPWLNEAARLLEEGIAGENPAEATRIIDSVCRSTFQIGMGPFALMNATGVAIAYHAERTLESLGPLYAVAKVLRDQGSKGNPWEIAEDTADSAPVNPDVEQAIRDRMLGVVFFVCGELLAEDVCTPSELNRGARIGLAWRKGPIEMMQAAGRDTVDRMINAIAKRYESEVLQGIATAFEPMQFVSLRYSARTAIITFERPEDLNALNEDVITQLSERFEEAARDPRCDTIVLTGTGKAFVAGADIGFFIKNIRKGSIERIIEFTERAQQVFDRIDRCPKRVIALLNGLTLGGGLELALCADEIYALKDAQLAFPETGIGIYPGLGGTQRTVRRTGKGIAKYLIFTGEMLGATDAAQVGLIDSVIESDEYFQILQGNMTRRQLEQASATHPWAAINSLFEEVTVDKLISDQPLSSGLANDEIDRFRKRIRQKAPIALHVAERLVNEARGCFSELEELPAIFRTSDALLGLSSVGKKVTFTGN